MTVCGVLEGNFFADFRVIDGCEEISLIGQKMCKEPAVEELLQEIFWRNISLTFEQKQEFAREISQVVSDLQGKEEFIEKEYITKSATYIPLKNRQVIVIHPQALVLGASEFKTVSCALLANVQQGKVVAQTIALCQNRALASFTYGTFGEPLEKIQSHYRDFQPIQGAVSILADALIRSEQEGKEVQTYYLATEFCPLKDLQKNLDAGAFQTPKEKKHLIQSILQLVSHLHQQQIVHRDLKVDNILVKEDGTLVLGDLDQCVRLQDQQSMMPFGCRNFAAPELLHAILHKATTPVAYTKEALFAIDRWASGLMLLAVALGQEHAEEYPSEVMIGYFWRVAKKFRMQQAKKEVEDGMVALLECYREELQAIHPRLSEVILGLVQWDPKERISLEDAIGIMGDGA